MVHANLFGPVRQWGFLVRDLDEALTCWVDQLGVGPWWGYRGVSLLSEFGGEESEVEIDVAFSYQNGVQIELIQQLNDVPSPYRAFYDGTDAQILHQLGFFVDDVDAAVQRGLAAGLDLYGQVSNPAQRYIYLQSPALAGLVVELMPADPGFMAEYERCAREAEAWDGRDPYRLITF